MTDVSAGRRELRRRSGSVLVGDMVVMLLLGAIAIWGFAGSYDYARPVVGGIVGLCAGTTLAAVAAVRGWGVIATAGSSVVAYFVIGVPVVVPERSLRSVFDGIADLARGALEGWADLLTLTAPVGAPDHVAVVPYLTGWIVGLVSSTIVWRLFRRDGRLPMAAVALLALLPAFCAFVVATVTGTAEPVQPLLRGAAFGMIAVVWLAVRVPAPAGGAARRREALGVVGVLVFVLVGSGVVAAASAAAPGDRLVVRDEIRPPFDAREFPSPLSAFRKYVKDGVDRVVLRVDGLEPGDLIRLAVMDTYDGRVWNVGDPNASDSGSGVFDLVSGRSLEPAAFPVVGDESTIAVDIVDYAGVWMPTIGAPTSVRFDAGAPPSSDLRYNAGSGVLVVTSGIKEGTSYLLDTRRVEADRDALAGVPVATIPLPPISDVPDIVAARAIEFAGDADSPIDRLTALELALSSTGYLSHGLASDSAPSSAGHGADRMIALLGRSTMVGDAEQYASAFALMARSFGYPARVVVGFAPDVPEGGGDVEVTADQVTAWAEVAFRDVGWVPFFPTATQTDVPREEAPKPRTEPQPQVRQPPRQLDGREEAAPPVQTDEGPEKCTLWAPLCDPVPWLRAILVAGAVVALYIVPRALIAAAKSRRRQRRRKDPRLDRSAAGAWDEVLDAYRELGYRIPPNALRLAIASEVEAQAADQVGIRSRERADERERRRRRHERRREREGAGGRPTAAGVWRSAIAAARDSRTWRPGVDLDGDEPTAPVLTVLAASTDDAVFGGAPIEEPTIEALWQAGDEAILRAPATVSWFRRRAAEFRYASRVDHVAGARAALERAADEARRRLAMDGARR